MIFSFLQLQRSQLLSYVICGDTRTEFEKIFEIATKFDIRKVLSRDMKRSKESHGTAIKMHVVSEKMIVGESGHRVDPVDGKSVAGNIFYVDVAVFEQTINC